MNFDLFWTFIWTLSSSLLIIEGCAHLHMKWSTFKTLLYIKYDNNTPLKIRKNCTWRLRNFSTLRGNKSGLFKLYNGIEENIQFRNMNITDTIYFLQIYYKVWYVNKKPYSLNFSILCHCCCFSTFTVPLWECSRFPGIIHVHNAP